MNSALHPILGAWLIGMTMVRMSSAQPMYSVVPVPAPEGSGAHSAAGHSINDFGELVGEYSRFVDDQVNQIRAFYHSDSTGSIDVWPEGFKSVAEGINNHGQIALHGGDFGGPSEAYRYTPGVGVESLGSFGGAYSETEAINNLGQVTGYSEGSDGFNVAFRYTDAVGLEPIGASFTSSRGYAINDLGWVAGWGDGSAFLFRDDLGLLDLGPGWAHGINDLGLVVGRSLLPSGGYDAFLFQDGTYQLLAQVGFQQTLLSDINNQGVAVGNGLVPMGVLAPRHALLWMDQTGFLDLNTLIPEQSGWTLISAIGINEVGQITGVGTYNGSPLAFRLDPVPEPATWCLLSLGALCGGLRWLANRRGRTS